MIHLLRKSQRLVHRLLDVRDERDRRTLPRRDVNTPDPALTPDHDRAAVGRPGILRVDAMHRPRLLQIPVEPIEDRRVLAGGEIPHVQDGLETDAPHERQPLAVR